MCNSLASCLSDFRFNSLSEAGKIVAACWFPQVFRVESNYYM